MSSTKLTVIDCVWNVMANAQKSDFVFRRNGPVHLNRRGRQFSQLLAAKVRGVSSSNAGYTMFRGIVKSTGYPLHLPVSPSLASQCVFTFQLDSNARFVPKRSQYPVHKHKSNDCTFSFKKSLLLSSRTVPRWHVKCREWSITSRPSANKHQAKEKL